MKHIRLLALALIAAGTPSLALTNPAGSPTAAENHRQAGASRVNAKPNGGLRAYPEHA